MNKEKKINTQRVFVAKAERKAVLDNKLSYGFGGEYKYDWGTMKQRHFHHKLEEIQLIIFLLILIQIKQKSITFHGRNDDHKETGETKLLKQILPKFRNLKLEQSHYRFKNPSLYELYGNIGQKILKLKKVKLMKFLQNIIFPKIKDLIYRLQDQKNEELNKLSWNAYENKIPDTTQEGLESEELLVPTKVLVLFHTL